jgi:hypothetical protein|tara:strand:+ start:1219 stop:1953 length:735 start_codon:yes stop_codon:yes gene_type:complete
MDTAFLRQRIADELERQPSDLIGSPSLSVGLVVNREINSAIKHYESTRFRWNEEREAAIATTVAGTRTYALPGNFVKMDSIKLIYSGGYIPLRKRSWSHIEDVDRRVAGSRGISDEYTIYGNVLRVYPAPNGAYTVVASYIKRLGMTSLTGSYCSSMTMTPTSTASHNNRRNGWTIDGEALVRARTVAAFRLYYERDEQSIAEEALLSQQRNPFLSLREMNTYQSLADEINDALATGSIRPYAI